MAYSEWQINRIRESLKAFYTYSEKHYSNDDDIEKVEKNSWESVSLAIQEEMGEKISGERLRAFVEGEKRVEGKNKKAKKSKAGNRSVRAWPVPRKIGIIVEFLKQDYLGLLSDDELRDKSPAVHAPLRLMEYMNSEYKSIEHKSCSALSGVFNSLKLDGDEIEYSELRIIPKDVHGLLQVSEITSYFDRQHAEIFSEWDEHDREMHVYAKKHASGWAVLTPEESIMVFMKDKKSGGNTYFYTWGSDKNITGDSEANTICLLRLGAPIALPQSFSDVPSLVKRIHHDTYEDVSLFYRNKKLSKKLAS